jgi:enoyl-CoA hydratase/carnithine racemase
MESLSNGLASIDVEDHRADVYLQRSDKRNAMTPELMSDLTEAFERVGAMDDVRAVTLLGEGPVFCAGMDLNMMRDRVDDPDIERPFPDLLETMDDVPQPIVAGIKRAAPAGAFELTLPCDFRILGEEAVYGVIETQLGTFPHGGATQRLPRLVGLSKAKEFVLKGEFIDPEEALQIGLVHDLVPDDDVDERTKEYANTLCERAPLGLEKGKQALDAALDVPLEEGLALELALGRQLDHTTDYREGFEARLEDRDPEFVGE